MLRETPSPPTAPLGAPIAANMLPSESPAFEKEVPPELPSAAAAHGPFNPRLAGAATRRIGFDLEIVPERHPYALGSSRTMPVRVYYQGKPLPGALVKLTNLDADARPVASKRTDGNGRSSFNIPAKGKWLLNVVWTKPISGNPKADFDTTFSSFTFGYPG
jgi:hypothetical protein